MQIFRDAFQHVVDVLVAVIGAGNGKYTKRIISEMIEWPASIVLRIGHTLTLKPSKGWKLIQFRWNVTKGLVGR